MSIVERSFYVYGVYCDQCRKGDTRNAITAANCRYRLKYESKGNRNIFKGHLDTTSYILKLITCL